MKKQEQQTEKELQAELKAMKKKITTAKKKRSESHARWREKKAAEKLVAAKIKPVSPSPIDETVRYVCNATLTDNSYLKVLRKGTKFYVITEEKNVLGVSIKIISEHDDKSSAVAAFSKNLLKLIK